jgi:hypothetical protein
MDNEKAIEVLIQVAKLAQSKGVLSLQDAVIVNQAVNTLTVKPEVTDIEKSSNDEK